MGCRQADHRHHPTGDPLELPFLPGRPGRLRSAADLVNDARQDRFQFSEHPRYVAVPPARIVRLQQRIVG